MPDRLWFQRALIALSGLLVVLGAGVSADDAVLDRMRRDITFLASDECEGRGPGTQGINKAAAYIAGQFEKAGLKPAGTQGFFQPFTVSGQPKLGQANSFHLHGPLGQDIELIQGKDYQVLGLSGRGQLTAPLVFIGYGISAPKVNYDDFKGINLAGKIAVILRHTPRWNNKAVPFDGARKEEHAALVVKQALVEGAKAAGVLLVNDLSESAAGDKLIPFAYVAGAASSSAIPSLQVRRRVLDTIMQSSLGTTLQQTEQAIDRDLKPRSAPLTGWTASIRTDVVRQIIPVKNIAGTLDGRGPLAGEIVVVGAHYDHLGYGGRGSLAKNKEKAIHHGADDNASGTTTLMELARHFGSQPDRQGRRLVFVAFSAEEMGLLGSRHYTNKAPLFPLADTVAMVNLDMVGRLSMDPKTQKAKLLVEGTGTAKTFDKLIESLNGTAGFHLIKKTGGTGPSDHDSFYRKQIPVVFFWTGTHKDYHRPSDTADKINVAGMIRIADLAEKVIERLATEKRPEYVKVASPPSTSAGKGVPRLGIRPSYEDDKEGVLLDDVTESGPAAKGGLKAGDRIVAIAGKAVSNLQTYMVLMGQQRRGQPVEISILRAGKKLSMRVVPQ